jgi:iron complex transport system substrate-binding protein
MIARREVLLGLLAAAATRGAQAQVRSLADSVGRVVVLPGKLARVMPAGPPASILIYAMVPELMMGWVPGLVNEASPFVLPKVRELPALPRLTGRNQTIDGAGIKALKPDLILDFGSTGASYVALADKVKADTGIPTALIDGKFDKLPASLKLAGDLLGNRSRGEALAAWAAETLANLDAALARVAADRRPRIYVARGAEGLQTGVKGSALTETAERAGAINVAQGNAGRGGGFDATREQIADWKPDLILAYDEGAHGAMRKAMPGTRLLLAPQYPWSWLGEPPSIQCLMGLRWLTGVFYRHEPSSELAAATREFHRLFYGVPPDEGQVQGLLARAI